MVVGPPAAPSLALETIWDVDQNPSYDVERQASLHERLVAAKTHAGKGELTFTGSDTPLCVEKDSLIVFDLGRVQRYRCAADSWTFWWFEFRSSSAPPCRLETVMRIAPHVEDESSFREVFRALRRRDPIQRAIASAGFTLMLHRWLAQRKDLAPQSPHADRMRRVIDLMHERSERGWPVKDMARHAHMGERRFRQVFRTTTGESPKRFFERLRLEKGRALLQLGIYTVKEVAGRLGFSSQFHFSREFSKHFGSPPQRAIGNVRPRKRR
jgi:AraC-like DNA-binding protein